MVRIRDCFSKRGSFFDCAGKIEFVRGSFVPLNNNFIVGRGGRFIIFEFIFMYSFSFCSYLGGFIRRKI